jgi:pimeloyl-ACP methyl ester carboxylesterase
MDRIVVVSGGGAIPDTEARQILNGYDCTRESMRRVVEALFMNPKIRNDADYVERRYRISLEPGAWECTAAMRFKAPGRAPGGFPGEPEYRNIKVPILIVAGDKDNLRAPGYAPELQAKIPGAELHVVRDAGHCPNIDAPDEFNRVVTDFLSRR